ncbi:MAG: transcription elongation factor GreA [Clostridiales bacterium]|nr:transcription elongation factor GreA [Clostridiales bacterium]
MNNVFTKKGFQDMQEKLEYLITVKRNEIADQIALARSFGDLSENAEYDEAKKEQAAMEIEILEIEEAIRNAVVLQDEDIKTDKVGIGTVVTIEDVETKEKEEFTIVGARENDPYENKTSSESPIGAALIGAKKGAKVTINVPAGELVYKVIKISRG